MKYRPNPLRALWRRGKAAVGPLVTLPSPAIAELFGLAGFDFVFIDCEHGPMGEETALAMMQAVGGTPAVPLIRVPWGEAWLVKRALDLGAYGVIVPMVQTAEDARRAVRAAKYPPQGVRGVGAARAQQYLMGLQTYLKWANREILVIPLIESGDGVENIEAIMKVRGVDAVGLGPFDLSGSLGLLGEVGHPKVQAALRRVLVAGQKLGVPVSTLAVSPEATAARIREGYRMIVAGADCLMLAEAAKAFVAAKR